MAIRNIEEVLVARSSSDGDGVKLKRVFGGGPGDPGRFDPYLMMDEFGSDEAADYIGGFPAHPHRGFETITYMLNGHMEHQDHMGNVGNLRSGDVQWMTAGAGIIHSEMPKQEEGLMRGFQVWLNLAARDKMQPASYQDIPSASIPVYHSGAMTVKAIAGALSSEGEQFKGAVGRPVTEPAYLDIHFEEGAAPRSFDVAEGDTVLLYVYEGSVSTGEPAQATEVRLEKGQLGRFSRTGTTVRIEPHGTARLVLLSGTPIGEPIVQYGPFVMNTREEIEQALTDYRNGVLAG